MDGWILLHRTVESVIESKSDILVAVVHWQLLRHGLKCIGIGDDTTLFESGEETEMLPDGWNISKTSYTLRYKYQNVLFILQGVMVGECLVFKLLNVETLKRPKVKYHLEQDVVALKGPLTVMIPEIHLVIDWLKNHLIEPVLSEFKKTTGTQTDPLPASIPDKSKSLWALWGSTLPAWDDLLPASSGRNVIDPFANVYGAGVGCHHSGLGGHHSGVSGHGNGLGGHGSVFAGYDISNLGYGMSLNPPVLRKKKNAGPSGPGTPVTMRNASVPFSPPNVEQQRHNRRDFDYSRPRGGSNNDNMPKPM